MIDVLSVGDCFGCSLNIPVLCRRMHEELKSAGSSVRLASQVASCISKALQLLAEKAEYMAATGEALLFCVCASLVCYKHVASKSLVKHMAWCMQDAGSSDVYSLLTQTRYLGALLCSCLHARMVRFTPFWHYPSLGGIHVGLR